MGIVDNEISSEGSYQDFETRDLSKDRDLVKSTRGTAEDRQTNLVISPEILRVCKGMLKEWDPREEPNLCIVAIQELIDQCPQAGDTMDPAQWGEEAGPSLDGNGWAR